MKTPMLRRGLVALLLVALAAPALAATQLTGAGSTFDYPFFSKAFYQYNQQHPDITVNYQSIGSGGGIEQFTQKTVDFGASDVPMNADELKRASGTVIQIPVALGGEAITYNLPDIASGLHFTRQLIAEIFIGKVTNWIDPSIAKVNPNFKLPNLPIIVVHRSDGSGTTYIFTDFLSRVSPEWKSKVGTGKSVTWPAASSVGGKGNEGVAGQVSNSPGAIGYVELAYALQNHMTTGVVQNSAGKYLDCTIATVRAAAATKADVSATDFSIVDRNGADAYPIAGYSWVMVYRQYPDKARAKQLHDVLEWLVGAQAQAIAATLDYVPLPDNVQATARKALSEMSV
ncbi:MAG: phosphate ABC transporter substrate-binding protein PstS [Candidatus Aquilonibacter sp.]